MCKADSSLLSEVRDRLTRCKVSNKDRNQVLQVLTEWYSTPTLNKALTTWEKHHNKDTLQKSIQSVPLSMVLYNVQGLNSRHLEVTELVNKAEASLVICTEVGELWNKVRIPDFNIFHEKGTNKNGGVVIGVGKHLKASKLEVNLLNTVIVDICGLNEPLRVIGIYWPDSQNRDLKDISGFITSNTIIAGDFNATVAAWNSPATDTRGKKVETWCIENTFDYISGTRNSSKRSLRNIDLAFSNFPGVSGETLEFGCSDHWPIVYKSESIRLDTISRFEVVKWKLYELTLCLLQDYWTKQHSLSEASEWYRNYIRFLNALKIRLTVWQEIKRWRPALPQEILDKFKIIRKLKKRLSKRHREEDRVLVRIFSREVRKEICEYKSSRWNSFLQGIQDYHNKNQSAFWKHLSRIYRPPTPPPP